MYLITLYQNSKKYFWTFQVCILLVVFSSVAWAVNEEPINLNSFLDNYQDKYYNYNEGPGAEIQKLVDASTSVKKYIYEKPFFKEISHLYWALNYHKIDNTKAVDQYMIINQCDMYKQFSADEIEWKEIRSATKQFLKKNKNDFPTRFEFTLPLKLGKYDKARGTFEIAKDYKIASSRRFEFLVKGVSQDYCIKDFVKQNVYPTVLILEYSRPVKITSVPMSEEKANLYIKNTRKIMNENYKKKHHSNELLKRLRNAYLVMKVKFFTHGKVTHGRFGQSNIQLMGVLEGYDIYESINKENLLYSESYISYKKADKVNEALQKQLRFLRKKSKEKGILH